MNSNNYSIFIDSPLGILKIVSNETYLLALSFCNDKGSDSEYIPEILYETKKQLDEYFAGERKFFFLKISPKGSIFQNMVWKIVSDIPFGKTVSYHDISKLISKTRNERAVGAANAKNPIPIIIPCHRIIGSSGKLIGYSGGLERKKWLLLHEQKLSKQENLLF